MFHGDYANGKMSESVGIGTLIIIKIDLTAFLI